EAAGDGTGRRFPLLLRRFIPELAYLTSLLVPTTVRLPLLLKDRRGPTVRLYIRGSKRARPTQKVELRRDAGRRRLVFKCGWFGFHTPCEKRACFTRFSLRERFKLTRRSPCGCRVESGVPNGNWDSSQRTVNLA
ncbi:unnamed protein product, partial [Ixodes persulcatus]